MKEDNTPTLTKRTRTPSRRLRLRLDNAKMLKRLNQKRVTVRQKKKDLKANAKEPDPEKHVLTSRVPRLTKNTLAEAPKATVKYKRRQVNKTWLPTHLWHTKRAHMTRPTEPLWRMAIPLSPTEKSYRPSHRAAGAQGCIAWDNSYMSTIACLGTESALDSMLKAFNFAPQGLSQVMQKKWKAGSRFGSGWFSERDNDKRPIAPVTVIWIPGRRQEMSDVDAAEVGEQMDVDQNDHLQPEAKEKRVEAEKFDKNQASEARDQMDIENPDEAQAAPTRVKKAAKPKIKLDHQILIRIHPSAFHQFWQELLKVAKMQKPQVLIEDLRFEIGSVEIQGPGSTEALLGVLRPFPAGEGTNDSLASLWTGLAGLNNPSILPQNAMLPVDIADPRLNHPPKQVKIPKTSDISRLDEILVSWPPDKTLPSSSLFSHKARWMLSKAMPSQKAINRRRALAPPGQPITITAKDPRIPVILLASRADNSTAKNSQGTWTVLMPWSCVDPVWQSLMYYPLTSGGTPRFGGLNQKQQLPFEQQAPWFPGDLPGTEAGKAWERTESEKRFDAWIRRPPKHRIAWDMLDLGLGRRGEIGRGWTCDWEYLFNDTAQTGEFASTPEAAKGVPSEKSAPKLVTQRQRKAAKAKEAEEKRIARRRNTSSPESEAEPEKVPSPKPEVKYIQLTPPTGVLLLKNPFSSNLPRHPVLMTIRITLLDKGTPSPAARIYRLPSFPKPKSAPQLAGTTTEDKSQESQPQSWPSDGPPPAQDPPTLSTADSAQSYASQAARAKDLRARWLALDPHSISTNKPLPKMKTNKFSIPRHQAAYPRETLANINVLPKNAPKEIIEKWGPDSAFGKGDGEIPKEQPPAPRRENRRNRLTASQKRENKRSKEKGKEKDEEEEDGKTKTNALDVLAATEGDLADLLINPFMQPTEWDKHPPCPDQHDLIGFVTSGGYNLAEGRGTAVGSIWAQRLIEAWQSENEQDESLNERERQRRRRLCIVRNAGESIGRLGVWEVCG